jgi:tRNA dimethylallyltransferase
LNQKTIILLVGPTAVGKTAVALALAQQLGTSVISADSRQCYRELTIGVAKPKQQDLDLVPHYFINSHSVHDMVHAGLFEELALEWASEIFTQKDFAIMVGGTGLYIQAFCEGLDRIPAADPLVRHQIRTQFAERGIGWLQEEVAKNDPLFYTGAESSNPHRLLRALEIKLTTGRSILEFRTKAKNKRPFRIIKTGLCLPKEILVRNIARRTEAMMADGLLEEARSLEPLRHLNPLRSVGYPELFRYLDGKLSLDQATDLIRRNTWQYARRQMTWFKKDALIRWTAPDQWEDLKEITQS